MPYVQHLFVVDFEGSFDGDVCEAAEYGAVEVILYGAEEYFADNCGYGGQEEGWAEYSGGGEVVAVCTGGGVAGDYGAPVAFHTETITINKTVCIL